MDESGFVSSSKTLDTLTVVLGGESLRPIVMTSTVSVSISLAMTWFVSIELIWRTFCYNLFLSSMRSERKRETKSTCYEFPVTVSHNRNDLTIARSYSILLVHCVSKLVEEWIQSNVVDRCIKCSENSDVTRAMGHGENASRGRHN